MSNDRLARVQDHNMVTALSWQQNAGQTTLNPSSNIGRDKSFVYDLNTERGIVRVRVTFVSRSAEIKPTFSDLYYYNILIFSLNQS